MKVIFNEEEIDKSKEYVMLSGDRKRGAVFMKMIKEDSYDSTTHIKDAFYITNRLKDFCLLEDTDNLSFSDLRKKSKYYPEFSTTRKYYNSIADRVRSSFEENFLEVIPRPFSGRKKDALGRVREMAKQRIVDYSRAGVEQIYVNSKNPTEKEILTALLY